MSPVKQIRDGHMTTPRQRMLATFEFARPDRIPLVYHPSTAGLHVHGEKLRALFDRYPPDNPITFDTIPAPPPNAVDADGRYYEELTDEWGVRWAYRVFGIQGQPVAYPFENWVEALDHPMPQLPSPDSEAFHAEKEETKRLRERYLLIEGWNSIFLQLYAMRPMDEVLIDLATGDRHLLAYLDRLVEYWQHAIGLMLTRGVDVVMFADDWATQAGQMVSTDLFRSVFKPRYEQLMRPVKQAGRRVFFHCCGKMDAILDELFDLGIDGLWPQIAFYDSEAFAQRCKDAGVTIYIHPDRQRLVPRGTPAEIRDTVKKYADRYHRLGGGGIFYIELENDAPFENAEALIEAVAELR